MTPQFLEKIDQSPVLRKAFQDPRFLQMSQELVKNPIQTLQQCQLHFPEWMEALKEFSGLLGEAFEAKANEVDTSGLDEFERGLVNRVVKDERVQVTTIHLGISSRSENSEITTRFKGEPESCICPANLQHCYTGYARQNTSPHSIRIIIHSAIKRSFFFVRHLMTVTIHEQLHQVHIHNSAWKFNDRLQR
jgi:hypothetical protein